ncbi:hypothetical protein LP419_03035 [Massilia sp. H-1]|nr:hypothetical protein LP419_03035 [Massilia sp. H-1]
MGANDQHVGDGQYRRRIDDHQVVLGTDGIEQIGKIEMLQELSAVGRQRASRNEVEILQHPVMDDVFKRHQ